MDDLAMAEFSPAAERQVHRLTERRTALLRQLAIRQYQDATNTKQADEQPNQMTLRHQITSIDNQIAAIGTRRRDESRRVIAAPNANGLAADVSQWHSLASHLPADTGVLAYWVTPAQIYAWLITRESIKLFDVGKTNAVQTAVSNLEKRNRDIREGAADVRVAAARTLGDLLLKNVVSALSVQATRLVIVADKSLHFVSFASLSNPLDPSQFLVERFDIAYAPSVRAVLNPRNPVPARKQGNRMFLVDDAIYREDDPRMEKSARSQSPAALSLRTTEPQPASTHRPSQLGLIALRGTGSLDRLPASADEADAVSSQFPEGKVDRLEGVAATRDRVLARDLSQYEYLHFAVHGISDAAIPQLSSLILSQFDAHGNAIDDRVWSGDFATRRLSAKAVVFSACDSGLGRPVDGEGLLGLRYVALARGAQSVVASQWEVSDRISAILMKEFYHQLLTEHRTPDSALAIAMRQVLHTGLRDPALWGAFTVTLAHL